MLDVMRLWILERDLLVASQESLLTTTFRFEGYIKRIVAEMFSRSRKGPKYMKIRVVLNRIHTRLVFKYHSN